MSLRRNLLAYIEANPGATYLDVHSGLAEHGYTIEQIRPALNFLTFTKALRCESGRAMGKGRGKLPGRYFATGIPPQEKRKRATKGLRRPKPKAAPVSSPWTLAGGVDMPWPPKFDGGRVFLHMAREDFMQEVA